MGTIQLDFEIELLNATKEVMVALVDKGQIVGWFVKGEPKPERIKDTANAIADALREAATKTR